MNIFVLGLTLVIVFKTWAFDYCEPVRIFDVYAAAGLVMCYIKFREEKK